MMPLESEALRTFVTVARTGAFSAAADTLARSQPAISRRVAQLEAQLGVPLFDRTPSGAQLSQAGRALIPHAERVLAALNDAAAAVADLEQEPCGPVGVAVVGTLAGPELTRPLKAFTAAHPKVRVSLSTGASAVVSEAVRRGEASIGVRYHRDASTDLECRPLGEETSNVACAAGHRLAGRRIASLRELAGEPWFAFPNAYAWRETTQANIFAQFAARGVPEIAWTPVDSLTAQKRLIEAGLGLALLPLSNVAEERASGVLDIIEVEDLQIATPVFAVTRAGGYLSRACRALLELLERDLAAALA